VAGPLPEPALLPEELRAAIVLCVSVLDEKQRRLYAGLEALKTGRGDDARIAALLGLERGTVVRERRALLAHDVDIARVRRAGGGRTPLKKTPDAIEAWWIDEARQRYPHARELAILADGGGSNGSRCRAWKNRLPQQLSERHGLSVTVAHYLPGASKWNPIEHRLFSEISKNWAGRPLDSYETTLNCIGTTTTKTGLTVRAQLLDRRYEKDVKITDAQMHDLPISNHDALPKWNYTLSPRPD